eukprot:239628_1
MPKNKNRTRGKSKDELLQNKEQMSRPDVPSNMMSSLGDTTVSKKKKNKKGSPELISMAAVQNNMNELHKIRVFTSIATGITAGILDLKGIYGFALFAIVFIITLIIMFVKMKMSINKYFRPSTKFITTSLWDGTMSFILFWTFSGNVLYLYGY